MAYQRKKKTGLRLAAFILAGTLAASLPASVLAGMSDATVQSYEDRIAEIQKKLDEAEGVLSTIQSEQAKTYEQIAQFDEIIELNNERRRLAEEQLSGIQWQIRDKQQSIDRTKANMEQQQSALLKRMRENYMENKVDYLEVLLTATSLFDFLKKLDYVDAFLRYDQEIITNLGEDQIRLEEDEAALKKAEEEQIEQIAEIDGYIAYNQSLYDQKLEYMTFLDNNEQWWTQEYSYSNQQIMDLDAELQVYLREQEEKRIREEQARILAEQQAAADAAARAEAEAAARLAAEQSAAQQAQAAVASSCWPLEAGVKVRVSSEWGSRQLWGIWNMHLGIDLACPSGTKVYAYSGGTVEKSQFHYSYGNYVVINHGGGLSTLYAHMANRLVTVGDVVEAGQQIGSVGLTGSTSGYHLHFEVRENGVTTNPRNYLVFP